jgi:hypothetical protein
MLGLVAAIELLVAGHPLEFSDPVSLNWRLSAEDAVTKAPGASILCVGDSLVKHGVIPKILQMRTGRRACNLAIARGPAPATYFLLRRALDAGAKPAALVVDYKPSVLVGSPRYNLRYWQEIATARECVELVRADGGGSLLTAIVVGRLLPTFRSRHEIRAAILAALRGEANPLRLIGQMCRRNWGVNDGANVAARNSAFHGEVGPDQQKALLWHVWYCHRANRLFIQRLLDLTASRQIPVYWLLPPLSPQLQVKREQSSAEAGYLKFVRSFQRKYAHLTIVDGRHSQYGHEVFVDATHLDGQGARTLSVSLSDILERDLSHAGTHAPRWINLRPYQPLLASMPLEDIEQSRKVVSARPNAR